MIKVFKPLNCSIPVAEARIRCGCGCGDWGDKYRQGFRAGVDDYFN